MKRVLILTALITQNIYAAELYESTKSEAMTINQSLQTLMARQMIRLDRIKDLRYYMVEEKEIIITRGCKDALDMTNELSTNIKNLKRDLSFLKIEKHNYYLEMKSGLNDIEAAIPKINEKCQNIPQSIIEIKKAIHGSKKFLSLIDKKS